MTSPPASDRPELLASLDAIAGRTPLLGETVRLVLEALVPAFADVAAIDVLAPAGELRRLGVRFNPVHTADAGAAERRLLNRPHSGSSAYGPRHPVISGTSQLLAPVTREALREITTTSDDLRFLESLGLQTAAYVPLRARGRILGVLTCSTLGERSGYTQEDVPFIETLGSRIGLALDNAGLSQTVSGLERRLEATLANLAAGVLVRGRDGQIVFANRQAAEMLGAESVELLFSTTQWQLWRSLEIFDEDGAELSPEQLPPVRALRGEHPEPLVARVRRPGSGRERWLLLKATPVFDRDGELSMAVSVLEDITEEKRSELAQRLLAEAGRQLAVSLDYEQTLQRLANLCVPELADGCAVTILETDRETLRQVAVAFVDPEQAARSRERARLHPQRLDATGGVSEVIRTGRAVLVPDLTPEVLSTRLTDGQRRRVHELDLRAAIVVPLALPGQSPFGALSLVMAGSGRTFTEFDLAVAEELGRRAATAVENARLYSERTRVARILQHSLLPPALPEIPGFEISCMYQPAGEESEVGGDFYDAFELPGDRWMLVVGDVAGHGAAAAALTALSRHTLRTAARLLGDPVAAIRELDRALRELPELSLVTVCCAVLELRDGHATAHVLLAGHPPALRVHAGAPEPVGTPAQLLGIDGEATWCTVEVPLEPGDLLVLYTDGVIDTFGEHERFGEQRLAETVREAEDPGDAVRRIQAALLDFARGSQRDDTAVVAVQFRQLGPDGLAVRAVVDSPARGDCVDDR